MLTTSIIGDALYAASRAASSYNNRIMQRNAEYDSSKALTSCH